ncbi:MAG: hypothetical protein JWR15_3947 [Prosthecobacter sp.]|nr:hypothetical protein [Prosthecobacter sp.]
MKNENVIYKMPEGTANQLFQADLSLLVKYAFENSTRISGAPDKYLKLLIGATMILVAIGKLGGVGGDGTFLDLIRANRDVFAATYGALAVISVLELLNVVRMRYHYVKVVRYLNQLRMNYFTSLDLDAMNKFIWTNSDVKMWPFDSISTFAAITLGISAASTAWVSIFILTGSFPWAFGVGMLAIAPSVVFSKIVKTKLKR